jgi:pilus assembly protein Flp/PilA
LKHGNQHSKFFVDSKYTKDREVKEMKKLWNKFVSEESGQGMVEYGLILALIAVVVIAVLQALGGKVKGTFDSINGAMP